MKETPEKHSELDFDFLSWRKANGYVGSFINIPLRNPKLTLSISPIDIKVLTDLYRNRDVSTVLSKM